MARKVSCLESDFCPFDDFLIPLSTKSLDGSTGEGTSHPKPFPMSRCFHSSTLLSLSLGPWLGSPSLSIAFSVVQVHFDPYLILTSWRFLSHFLNSS